MNLYDQEQTLNAVVTEKQFVSGYLQLWKGGFNLTGTQFKLTKMLVEAYMELYKKGIREPYLSESVLSTRRFSDLRFEFKVKKQRMYNMKNELKNLKVIVKGEDGYIINPCLIPKTSITFNFKVQDET